MQIVRDLEAEAIEREESLKERYVSACDFYMEAEDYITSHEPINPSDYIDSKLASRMENGKRRMLVTLMGVATEIMKTYEDTEQPDVDCFYDARNIYDCYTNYLEMMRCY